MILFATLPLWAPSSIASEDPVVPSEPVGLVAVPDVDGSILLLWRPPASDGGAPVMEYRVYRATLPDAFSYLGSSGVTDYSDGATDGPGLYAYQVSAVNAAGEGPASPFVVTGATGHQGSSCIAWDGEVPPGIGVNWFCLGVCPLPSPLPWCFTDLIKTG